MIEFGGPRDCGTDLRDVYVGVIHVSETAVPQCSSVVPTEKNTAETAVPLCSSVVPTECSSESNFAGPTLRAGQDVEDVAVLNYILLVLFTHQVLGFDFALAATPE